MEIIPDTNSDTMLTPTGNTGSNIINDVSDPSLSIQDSLLNDSRITPTGNGNPLSKPYCTQPTSAQKWWAAALLGFLFALISSPAAYNITSQVTSATIGLSLTHGEGPNFIGLLIHTLIFIVIVRVILW